MYRTLQVPLDGSTFAEHALPLALQIAQKANATLNVVQVHVPVASAYSGNALAVELSLDATIRDSERTYLKGVIQRLASVSPVRVTQDLLEGPVAAALSEHATGRGADLIVMATHGRRPLSRFLLGSVADKLVRQAPMPLLLVRPGDEVPDLTATLLPQHILIPLDGSKLAEQILGPATALGSLVEADYTLLRVIEPIILPDAQLAGNAVGGLNPSVLQRLEEQTQAYLDRVADGLRARSLHVKTRQIVNRPAARAILAMVREHPDYLIALATHGRGGLARLLLGSVADKVVRGSPVPVLVARPSGH
jgi:nucleotide-binding universal stress UspA family protein